MRISDWSSDVCSSDLAYIAHRADWLADPVHWAERTRSIEERLSDALHASLTQRFVDKRTTILMRRIGADVSALPVVVDDAGEVLVEDHPDRKSVVEGKSVSVRVDLGGRRIIKKKNKNKKKEMKKKKKKKD